MPASPRSKARRTKSRKMVAAFDERRRVIVPLLNQLPGFRCLDPGGAFYVFPNITGTGMDARELQNRMLEKAGVATVAGTSFGIHGEGYIRFSYANSSREHPRGHQACRRAAAGVTPTDRRVARRLGRVSAMTQRKLRSLRASRLRSGCPLLIILSPCYATKHLQPRRPAPRGFARREVGVQSPGWPSGALYRARNAQLAASGPRYERPERMMQLCNGCAPRLPHRNRAHIVGVMCLG